MEFTQIISLNQFLLILIERSFFRSMYLVLFYQNLMRGSKKFWTVPPQWKAHKSYMEWINIWIVGKRGSVFHSDSFPVKLISTNDTPRYRKIMKNLIFRNFGIKLRPSSLSVIGLTTITYRTHKVFVVLNIKAFFTDNHIFCQSKRRFLTRKYYLSIKMHIIHKKGFIFFSKPFRS